VCQLPAPACAWLQMKDSITREHPKTRQRQAISPEALQCCGALALALGEPWAGYAAALLEPMVLTGDLTPAPACCGSSCHRPLPGTTCCLD